MNKRLYFIILLLGCKISNAQNLVPNGNFEQFSICPNSYSQLDHAISWINPSILGSPDYYNQCAPIISGVNVPNTYSGSGYQMAHSGVAYSGIYIAFNGGFREYIETPLTFPLTINNCYHFEMYVNLSNTCQHTTDAIAVYFSDTAITGVNHWFPLPYIPQINNITNNTFDSLGWTLVSGNYTATGGENYLIIGNFKDDANTTPILIYPGAPSSFVYCYVDDVCLTYCGTPCSTVGIQEPKENTEIEIYPNPVLDKMNITTKGNALFEVSLYDVTSRKIFNQSFTSSTTINTEQLAKGIYVYEVRNKNGVIKKGKVVKD